MTKQLSEHAAAAKMIRNEIKRMGITGAKVKASTASMTSSVNVYLPGVHPSVKEEVETYVNQFAYGEFNGMDDSYSMTNRREDLPQVKYTFVDNTFTDERRQEAYDYLLNNFAGLEGAPADVKDAGNFRINDKWADTVVWQVLNGSMDKHTTHCKFWNA